TPKIAVAPKSYTTRWDTIRQRMTEFLVKDAVPLDMVTCVIAKTPAMEQNLREQMASSNWNIPILVKPGCYFS
ncbi:DarT ssDNA thymidine ADP-ribosyltransferase family protein, partial [Novosphingobium sp.]|uniref:DarT ssDNA thymidine ADP-ribosyltransferase family protein n=1 Tax=Novosphingobium sp. TaxID=1874826 RepID=UPI00333FE7D0